MSRRKKAEFLPFCVEEVTESYVIQPFDVGSKHADLYRGRPGGRQGRAWEPPNGHRVYPQIRVLRFLKDMPWDDLALAWVSSLQPSHIRVIAHGEGIQLDAQLGRVTVELNKEDRIRCITMETVCWAPEKIESARHLDHMTCAPGIPFAGGALILCNSKALTKVQFEKVPAANEQTAED